MSVMRLEPIGAGGQPRGHGRWEHNYGTALPRWKQVPSRPSFKQK